MAKGRTSVVTRRSNPDHHSALPILALAVPRTQIEPHKGDKRYVRRKKGKFTKSQDEVGRSLTGDRRKHAKTKVKLAKVIAAIAEGCRDNWYSNAQARRYWEESSVAWNLTQHIDLSGSPQRRNAC
jgi:hypothetical protein